jgi:hypothetical protein
MVFKDLGSKIQDILVVYFLITLSLIYLAKNHTTYHKSYQSYHNIDPWIQSYDFDLQRQRCKFLQRYG